MTLELQVMVSSNSHQNALQRHMVNWSLGLKCKLGYMFEFYEYTHVCIGLK